MTQQNNLAADVMAAEKRWVQAHRDLNVADIEDILDDDYKIIQNGEVVGKQAVVDSYRSGKRRWAVADAGDYTVRVIDDVALVVGVWRGVGINCGEVFDYSARFMAVYVRRSSGWKLFRDEYLDFDR
jgi:ketosteroid isomerase-like protein